jgi:hypothetical protein
MATARARACNPKLALVFVAALGLLPRTASAQAARRPALHWVRLDGAEGCINPRALAERVESITGSVFVPASSAEVSLEARLEVPEPGRFVVHIKQTPSRGAAPNERVAAFSTHDCRTLDAAIAFLIAMTIDPDLATSALAGVDWLSPDADPRAAAAQLRSELSTATPVNSRDVLAEPAVEPRLDSPTQPAAAVTSKPPLPRYADLWELSAAVGGGYGPMSSPSVGLAVSLGRGLSEHFALGAQLRAATATHGFSVDSVRSVGSQTLGFALLACATLFDPNLLGVSVCAGPELSLLIASGHGFEASAVTTLPTPSASARLQLQHRFSSEWSLIAAVLGQLDLGSRTIYYVREGQTVDLFEPHRSAAQLVIGIARIF